jgi:hypothetical protein
MNSPVCLLMVFFKFGRSSADVVEIVKWVLTKEGRMYLKKVGVIVWMKRVGSLFEEGVQLREGRSGA